METKGSGVDYGQKLVILAANDLASIDSYIAFYRKKVAIWERCVEEGGGDQDRWLLAKARELLASYLESREEVRTRLAKYHGFQVTRPSAH